MRSDFSLNKIKAVCSEPSIKQNRTNSMKILRTQKVYILMGPSNNTRYVGYFVCDSASEFGAMGSTSFFGVFLP